MASDVPEDIIAKTTQCEHGHSCLDAGQDGDKPLCEMDRSYGENLLSAKKCTNRPCPYRVFFGYGYICACPIHGAISSKSR